MDSLLESMGLLCLAVKSSHGSNIGRTKLQKMIYFVDRYLDWDVGDYRMHYYGPYSRNVSLTLRTIQGNLVAETAPNQGTCRYDITEQGEQFLAEFVEHACDENRIRRARVVWRAVQMGP